VRQAAAGKPEGWELPFLPGTLLAVPPEPLQSRLDRVRREHDPKSAERAPVHISICQPFREQPGREEMDRVRAVLAGFEPFTVELGELRNFLPYPCLWLEVQPAERILDLRRALHATGLFNTDLEHTDDFIPHLSITDGTPDPETSVELYEQLKGRVKGGKFRLERLIYSRPDWQMHFLPVEELPLGKPNGRAGSR